MDDADAAHIAANNPATIEAFCAVAKAARKHYEDDDLNIALNDLYDALGKE
jgi:hypothetical protein